MANWSKLKAAIANAIKTNGNNEITGQLLQNVLTSVVTSVGENATFAGIASPTTNPGAPDGPVFYLATKIGTYSNFGKPDGSRPVISGYGTILLITNKDYVDKTKWATEVISDGLAQKLGSGIDIAMSQKAITQQFNNFVVCNSEASAIEKIIAWDGFSLDTSKFFLVKFTNGNTANNITLNINNTGAKTFYYQGFTTSSTNTFGTGRVLLVFYDLPNNVYNAFLITPIKHTTGYSENYVMSQKAITQQFDEIKLRLIKLVGAGPHGLKAGAEKIGDIFYNTETKLLRRAVDTPAEYSVYETVPFIDGAIYTLNGGLYIWDGEDLLPASSKYIATFKDSECTAAFIKAMQEKADKIGMNIQVEGVAGHPDNQISDAKSCAKMFLVASSYPELTRIWNTKDDITIYSKGKINTAHLLHSTVFSTDSNGHYANQLTDYYELLGGKTGTSSEGRSIYGVIVKGRLDTLLVGWVRCHTWGTQSINRYKAMKLLMDIAFIKQANSSADITAIENSLIAQNVDSAQVLQIPMSGDLSNYETFDIFSTNPAYTNYNIYSYNNEDLDSIASNTKVLNIITALDYISDLDELVTIKPADFVGTGNSATSPEFIAGEQFTVRELMLAMMMPSSNCAARALGRHVGAILLKNKYKNL